MTAQEKGMTGSVLPDDAARQRLYRKRRFMDGFSRYIVGIGGISVIVSLALIFVYLFSEVGPMMMSAHSEKVAEYPVPGEGRTIALSMERFRSVGFRLGDDGDAVFFRPATGEVLKRHRLPIPDGVEVTSDGAGEPRTRLYAIGLSNGEAIFVRDSYRDTFPDGRLVVVPDLEYPFGNEPVAVDPQGRAIKAIGIQQGMRGIMVGAVTEDNRLLLVSYQARTNFMTGETELVPSAHELPRPTYSVTEILVSITLQEMIIGDTAGNLHYYDISRPAQARLMQSRPVFDAPGISVTALNWLLGAVSVIVGGSDGSVSQWFLVRDDDNVRHLTRIREFQSHPAPVTRIMPEYARKGFVTADRAGNIALHFSTSHRSLLMEKVSGHPIIEASIAPRNNGLFVTDEAGRLHYYKLDNEHPQYSFSALWSKVWYEGSARPDYVWQSSSATDEFEPKFSLVPLTVGTLKAAFYAMLFAMPLAIMGAIYSAYFMSPRMRGMTKPTIEIMEALPTVILGFLAGLWFAPFLERHLPAVFSILILMPVAFLVTAFVWSRLSTGIRAFVGQGWEAALLIPVVLFIGWLCVTASPYLELWFFSGDMRQWLTDIGITYDQRNAMVVGVAMGFAVIPTIYSIAEDAVFNVPKHLTQGSLALGATTWQTVTRVVLLTASPGIFSAVMIGMGRAVGETMIVLMATGNSPVVNFNIFEGMRTLSANIAVEMPEAEFGGTHYRILFLSALVLFILTFAFNTIAEVVRQRLRRKYASI
jgi:phosphate transport system permease protein